MIEFAPFFVINYLQLKHDSKHVYLKKNALSQYDKLRIMYILICVQPLTNTTLPLMLNTIYEDK